MQYPLDEIERGDAICDRTVPAQAAKRHCKAETAMAGPIAGVLQTIVSPGNSDYQDKTIALITGLAEKNEPPSR
jgi:hypothetical protein